MNKNSVLIIAGKDIVFSEMIEGLSIIDLRNTNEDEIEKNLLSYKYNSIVIFPYNTRLMWYINSHLMTFVEIYQEDSEELLLSCSSSSRRNNKCILNKDNKIFDLNKYSSFITCKSDVESAFEAGFNIGSQLEYIHNV